ncbi:MAG: ATP-dependent Clp protease ATP-binding subunit [Clostridia bacterium]|nr:ATP-dependent Clp protease ATP-binding subunit [Clostridia bacterium]
MMLCNICKKNLAVIFSSKEENGTRKMEGLCVSCAKKQGINTDEILKAQTDAQAKNLNNGLEDLFQHLAESLNGIDGVNFEAMAFPDMGNMNFANNSNDEEDDDDDEEQNSKRPPIFAGAIPLGSIFGSLNNFRQNNGQDETSNSGSNVKKKVKPEKKKNANKKKKYLDTFGTNLTVKAKNGELDMVVGRDRELQRVIQILNRRTKNNPCLIGEPGVGKTAIAQGLAIKIANQKVPVKLLNKEVYLLDMTAVLAGTQFRGQFESRMKGIIEECIHYGNIILVIDEVHSIIGAGAGGENDSMNAANILKPALANGQVQLIGTTTIKEYRKYIEKDTALERRFQQVMIDEPSSDDAIDILKGIKKYYEDYHKVKISNEVIKQTVLMSEKYIHDRFLPDKAIDILDEACSRINLENVDLFRLEVLKNQLKKIQEEKEDAANADSTEDYQKAAQLKTEECKLIEDIDRINSTMKIKSLTVQDIAGVIESWTKIPVKKITEKETEKLLNLEENLHKRIIGQEYAVSAVSRAIRRNRAGLKSTQRPPSFIFVGPTGVGKTELAKSLAYEMFGTEESIIRIDMSEYMESNSTAKLIGAPPGYVGYDDAGQLTEKVKRKPYSIILLDEIEKAHPDVFNLLLQILDDGRLTDSQGNTVSFQNTIIIMTSNAGSNLNNNSIGFGNETIDKGKIEDRLKDTFRPEFLNRVDEIIVFNSLNKEQLLQIVDLMLNDTKKVLLEKDITMEVSEEAKEFILEKGTNLKFGARPLRRAIQRYVEDEISEKILRGEIKNGQTIKIEYNSDKLEIVGE